MKAASAALRHAVRSGPSVRCGRAATGPDGQRCSRPAKPDFEVYLHEWITRRKSGKGEPLRARTQVDYRAYVDRLFADFHARKLASITKLEAVAWWEAELKRGTRTQASRAYSFICTAYTDPVAHGLVDRNPGTFAVRGTPAPTSATPASRRPHRHAHVPDFPRGAVGLSRYG